MKIVEMILGLFRRPRPEFDDMSDDELLDEAYAEAEFGNFPNEYSREYDRRMMFGRAV